jgi:hypothetical protein
MITITLTPEERDLLLSALDSHQYWQLSDSNDRNNGFVHGASAEGEEHLACDALIEKLENAQEAPV